MLHNVLHARYATNILLVPPHTHTHTHDLHGLQDPHESGQESYVPPVEAYSEEADPEWTDSQPILPSPEYELPHTQPDESEEEAWEGPPVPEIPEKTPKAKVEIEGAEKKTSEVDSEDELLTRERFVEVVVNAMKVWVWTDKAQQRCIPTFATK